MAFEAMKDESVYSRCQPGARYCRKNQSRATESSSTVLRSICMSTLAMLGSARDEFMYSCRRPDGQTYCKQQSQDIEVLSNTLIVVCVGLLVLLDAMG
jgi:hypothetical protein